MALNIDKKQEDLILPLDAFVRSVGVNRARQHALFLGAGASVSSGVPSAEECIWEWKRNIFVTKNPGLEEQFSELSLPSVQSRIQEWLDREGTFPPAGSAGEYGFYIEHCYPIMENRRAYFQDRIRSAKPHVGYRLLSHLAQGDIVRSVWTTNFDGFATRTATDFNLTTIEVGIDCQGRLHRIPSKGELVCVSLHGDYRYDSLKNTQEELQTQETELREALIRELRNTPMIVIGYSGRDQSVMEVFKTAYTGQGLGTLYWCGYGDGEIPEHIADLIRHARANGRQAFYVPSQGFDDLMTRLVLHCLDGKAHRAAKNDLAQVRANEHTEQGQQQERLKNAIEHLGHEKNSVRLGGAYELFHLAKDNKELRQTVLDLLCAHIRWATGESEYQKAHALKPSEEVQSILRLLFVQEHKVFKGLQINLQESWLNGANLRKTRLQGAVLTGAHLQKADLREACLQGAYLDRTHLQEANLSNARLQGAMLIEARLQGVILKWAYPQGAILYRAYLQKANLSGARLQGAILYFANLQCANMKDTGLQGAILCGAHLQGAILWMAHLQGVVGAQRLPMDFQGELHMWGAEAWRNLRKPSRFAKRMRESIDREGDISGMVFKGGLIKENVDSFVEGLSNKKANELREELEPHVDRDPSIELPTDSGADTEPPYTKEEAEQWIAEYEEAMSEVPEDDS